MHFQVPCGWGWASILGLVHESISHAWNLCKVWDDALQELSWTMTGPGSQASQAPKARLRVIFYNFWGIWNPGTHLRNPSEEPIWGTHLRNPSDSHRFVWKWETPCGGLLPAPLPHGLHRRQSAEEQIRAAELLVAEIRGWDFLGCWQNQIAVCHLFFFWMARNCQNLFCW